jgi:hypothetical protein
LIRSRNLLRRLSNRHPTKLEISVADLCNAQHRFTTCAVVGVVLLSVRRKCRAQANVAPKMSNMRRPQWSGKLRRLSKSRWAWKSTCMPAQRANKLDRDHLPGFRSALLRAAAGRPIRTSNSSVF